MNFFSQKFRFLSHSRKYDIEEKTCKKFRLLKRLVDDELCVADVMDLTFPNGTVDLVTLGDFYGGTNLKDRVGDMVGQAERCETAAQRFGDKKGYQMAEEFLTK